MDDLDDLVKQLTLDEKTALLTGQDFWSLPAIERIGLRSLVMSDGPIGVRGTGYAPDDPSVALPSPTALAAAWRWVRALAAGALELPFRSLRTILMAISDRLVVRRLRGPLVGNRLINLLSRDGDIGRQRVVALQIGIGLLE